MPVKGKLLRIFGTKAIFEDQETGNCLLVHQGKDLNNGGTQAKTFEKFHKDSPIATSQKISDDNAQVLPMEAIFGIYDMLSGAYAALVVESEPFVSVGNNSAEVTMRKAKKILVVPLFRNGRLLSDHKQRDEDRYLQLLHKAFSEHQFFFSSTCDITLTQQQIAKGLISSGAVTMQGVKEASTTGTKRTGTVPTPDLATIWRRADPRFFWNREAVADLIRCEADEWIVPFMSAFVEVRTECSIQDNVVFNMLLISRRSQFRQGCRFTRRGLDKDGNAANFVETEQILYFGDGRISSYVQIRGSIPVVWSSPVHMKYDPVVNISEDRAYSLSLTAKHVSDIVTQYSSMNGESGITFINLVDRKKDQQRLGLAFEQAITDVRHYVRPHHLEYVWWDFHKECKQKGKWNNLTKLVTIIEPFVKQIKYFSRDSNGHIRSWQTGVCRTNCMDNLDRTNVVQSLLARRSLIIQTGMDSKICVDSHVLGTPWTSFENTYKAMWANNANCISLGYAGTGALKVDFTKTGKRTIKGIIDDGINSCHRYYINNFTDGVKQDALDVLLSNFKPNVLAKSPFKHGLEPESLLAMGIRSFVLLVLIFATLVLLLPPRITLTGGTADCTANTANTSTCTATGIKSENLEMNLMHLQGHLLLAATITSIICLAVLYKVTKLGSAIGERLVVRPVLVKE